MNKPFLHRCFLLAITLLLTFKVNAQKTEKDKTPQTITLKSEVLVKTKQALAAQQADKVEALKKFLEEADNLVKKGKLYSVVDKKEVPPSGDKHDYMSIGPYWWPDTTKPDGLPYIRRDGERNPEYYDVTDASYRSKMSTESEHLALAYYLPMMVNMQNTPPIC
ncbi:MAG: hypothetical protein HC817_02855 [Saprospiraceae bacterium]|nr:hypothetical protein [Saprospiraceae bacterium]